MWQSAISTQIHKNWVFIPSKTFSPSSLPSSKVKAPLHLWAITICAYLHSLCPPWRTFVSEWQLDQTLSSASYLGRFALVSAGQQLAVFSKTHNIHPAEKSCCCDNLLWNKQKQLPCVWQRHCWISKQCGKKMKVESDETFHHQCPARQCLW